ncbi:MAG: FecR domain-containing protein [Bacteroidota bacterium]
MNQPNKEQLIQEWLAGRLSEEELLQSISQQELDEYKKILKTVDDWEPEGSDEIHSKLDQILSSPKEAKVVPMNRSRWLIGIAASVTLISFISYFFLSNPETTYYTENEVIELTLPDNSTKVVLSPGASISYKDFDREEREVVITGRVYFDVTEKGPFKVNHTGGNIQVLGTQFEVVDIDEVFEATCFEGLIQVEHRGRRIRAGAKSRVAYVRGGLESSNVNSSKPGWIDQETETFERASLTKVIKIIEARYKVEIVTGSISLDRRFTGTIPIDNLEQACRKVFSTLGIQYKIEGKRVLLSE